MARVRRVSTAGDWEAAVAMLSEYVDWMRVSAGFDPLVEQPGFATELASLPAQSSCSTRQPRRGSASIYPKR